MPHTVVVLTGASRGLGASMARAFAAPGVHLITLARGTDSTLRADVEAKGATLDAQVVDLSDAATLDRNICTVIAAMPRAAERYVLINNAGAVAPVAQAGNFETADVATAFTLNVTALIMLTSRFLSATEALKADRRIVNISSGAGRAAKSGWSVYCATKAAVDMFSKSVKLEQAEHGEHGARIVSLAPGVVDTDMQVAIRSATPEQFPGVAAFQDMKETGKLATPDAVAAKIAAYVARDDFGSIEIDDIRNY